MGGYLMEFFNLHREAVAIFALLIYSILILFIFCLIRNYYKSHYIRFVNDLNTKKSSLCVLTSYDVFPDNEQIERMQAISAQLGRVNHRVFSNSIFTTIRNGLRNNDQLLCICDCDEENIDNV